MTCTVDGCTKPARARGMCDNHYRKRRRMEGYRPPDRQRKPPVPAGSQTVTCGDCGQLIAVVRTDDAVRQAIDHHTCTRKDTT